MERKGQGRIALSRGVWWGWGMRSRREAALKVTGARKGYSVGWGEMLLAVVRGREDLETVLVSVSPKSRG